MPQLFLSVAHQQLDGAFDIGGGEGLAVVPFDIVPQWKGQLGPLLVPAPTCRQIRYDRTQTVLRHVLVEHN